MKRLTMIFSLLLFLFFGCINELDLQEPIQNFILASPEYSDVWSATANETYVITRGTKIDQTEMSGLNIAVDLKNKQYLLYSDNDELGYALINDTLFKKVVLQDNCSLRSSKGSFFDFPDEVSPLFFFLFTDYYLDRGGESAYQELLGKMSDMGNGELIVQPTGESGDVSGSFRKHGEHYFGEDITYIYGNSSLGSLVYYYKYEDISKMSERSFNNLMERKLRSWESCSSAIKETNDESIELVETNLNSDNKFLSEATILDVTCESEFCPGEVAQGEIGKRNGRFAVIVDKKYSKWVDILLLELQNQYLNYSDYTGIDVHFPNGTLYYHVKDSTDFIWDERCWDSNVICSNWNENYEQQRMNLYLNYDLQYNVTKIYEANKVLGLDWYMNNQIHNLFFKDLPMSADFKRNVFVPGSNVDCRENGYTVQPNFIIEPYRDVGCEINEYEEETGLVELSCRGKIGCEYQDFNASYVFNGLDTYCTECGPDFDLSDVECPGCKFVKMNGSYTVYCTHCLPGEDPNISVGSGSGTVKEIKCAKGLDIPEGDEKIVQYPLPPAKGEINYMCFWNLLVDNYGVEKYQEVLQKLYSERNSRYASRCLVRDYVNPVVGEDFGAITAPGLGIDTDYGCK
jgi:hypothetical protein